MPYQQIKIEDIVPTENRLSEPSMRRSLEFRLLAPEKFKLITPQVKELGGKYLILDGHNRAAISYFFKDGFVKCFVCGTMWDTINEEKVDEFFRLSVKDSNYLVEDRWYAVEYYMKELANEGIFLIKDSVEDYKSKNPNSILHAKIPKTKKEQIRHLVRMSGPDYDYMEDKGLI